MQTEFRAGVARQLITPPRGIMQIGYGDRIKGNQGVHDDLTATAVVFDDGSQRFAIVACDLLAVNERITAQVQAAAGIPVMLSCSHTHSAPITYAGERSPKANQKYVKLLVERLVQAVGQAQAALQPAVLYWAAGQADIAINRREEQPDGHIEIGQNPHGVVDRSLGIVQVRAQSGEVLGTMVNFCCHGTVLGPNNLLISADWPGEMRKVVEAATGAPCMFIQGATGNLNPLHDSTNVDWKAVAELGGRVGQAVMEALPGLQPIDPGPVKFAETQVWLPLEAEANTPQPPPTYRKVLAKMTKMPSFFVDPILNSRYPWETTIEARQGVWSTPMILQVARVGGMAYVGYAMEVFTEIGLAVKSFSPAKHTLFASLTSGCTGYLATPEEHARGGYEVEAVPFFYRLPGKLAPTAASCALDETRRLLDSLWI